jgi:anthranilate synthase component 1
MTPEEFAQLAAQGYNRIPVMREVLADLDTPLSSYLKLARGAYSYLFESVQGGEKWGRYSMIGLPARTVLKAFGDQIRIERDGQLVEEAQAADALAFVESFKQRYRAPELPGLPRFTGGLVGYFAYDCVRYVEPHLKKSQPADVIGTPDILLCVSDEVLVFDNLAGKLIFVVHANPEIANAFALAQQRLDELEARLRGPVPSTPDLSLGMNGASEQEFRSHTGEERFREGVERIKDYVLAGDCMQWWFPSDCRSTSTPSRSTSIARCATSIHRLICISWIWEIIRWWAPARKFSRAWKMATSPCVPLRVHAVAVTRRKRTGRWKWNWSMIPRKLPST